jgi:hypothetical protein
MQSHFAQKTGIRACFGTRLAVCRSQSLHVLIWRIAIDTKVFLTSRSRKARYLPFYAQQLLYSMT